MSLFNHNAMALNDTQRAALDSVADGHPAGVHSTFRALERRGYIRADYDRGRWVLTALGLNYIRTLRKTAVTS